MLDDINVLKQRDPSDVLAVADEMYGQVDEQLEIVQAEHDNREIHHVIVAGMGGSTLAADALPALMGDHLRLPYQVTKGYELPPYASHNSLVIVSSYSGNTEETLACYRQARECGSQVAVITAGGALLEHARQDGVAYIQLHSGTQPRMAMIVTLRAILLLLQLFGIDTSHLLEEIADTKQWLNDESSRWSRDVATQENYAKQLALMAVGKTPVFYGGPLTASLAYKWKISWNENAKNTAFFNQYPEFNHNEFIGWSSHPVDKPFAVFDIVSDHESIRITERMELSDKLLSGLRPKAQTIHLVGDSFIQEFLWGAILADYASIYTALLNGVNPEPVALVEKFKKELS